MVFFCRYQSLTILDLKIPRRKSQKSFRKIYGKYNEVRIWGETIWAAWGNNLAHPRLLPQTGKNIRHSNRNLRSMRQQSCPSKCVELCLHIQLLSLWSEEDKSVNKLVSSISSFPSKTSDLVKKFISKAQVYLQKCEISYPPSPGIQEFKVYIVEHLRLLFLDKIYFLLRSPIFHFR